MATGKLGAQLFTLRDFCRTLPDIETTLKKVKAIGYAGVQVSGIGPVDVKEAAKVFADSGLTIAATHVGWDRFRNDLDGVIEQHRLWKCRHPAIGGLGDDYATADGLRKFVDELGPVAGKLAAAGMDFSYHNHNHEFQKLPGGKTWLATLYDSAPAEHLKAEIDTYWVAAGGGDPAWWVRRCAGREPLLHLKDMVITAQRETRMAEVGEGNLNWPAILDAAKAGGVEWYLVEQDSCYERDPFASMAISYRNLAKMGLR